MRTLLTIFLAGHAIVHAVMWTLPFTDATQDMPFDPAYSWLIGRRPAVGAVLAGVATIGFLSAAIGIATRVSSWPTVLGAAAVVSLALMLIYLSKWWTVGIVLSAVLLVLAPRIDPNF